ncbi:MAG: wax ester/triacylglycerol synthase family O-acyltransferase [Acidimicrobiia bacterium]|nr:wax ester/triacylglycerol synthase family O-acyltransferase [Acidimicrobiia bacterium]
MKRLSGLDAGFLYGETPTWHMHVGALLLLGPSERPLDVEGYRAFLEERLPLIDTFRRRPAGVPFGLDRPVWEEVAEIDLRHHVRRVRVPEPGGPRELSEALSPPFATRLDFRRPLWEAWVAEGLPDGRAAVLLKIHHAVAGGFTGLRILEHLLDVEPAPAPVTPVQPSRRDRVPSPPERLGRAAASWALLPLRTARLAPGLARAAIGLARFRTSPDWADATLPFQAPRTSFNRTLTSDRALAFFSVPLDDVKRVKDAVGVTVNDVVLALCGGALRRYLAARGELPDRPLVAQVPVAVHTPEAGGPKQVIGNQLTVMGSSLATHVADPIERLRAIHAGTESGKHLQHVLGDDLVQDILGVLPRPSCTAPRARTRASASPTTTRRSSASSPRTCPVRRCRSTRPGPGSSTSTRWGRSSSARASTSP